LLLEKQSELAMTNNSTMRWFFHGICVLDGHGVLFMPCVEDCERKAIGFPDREIGLVGCISPMNRRYSFYAVVQTAIMLDVSDEATCAIFTF